ncbi:hypothetical protein ZOSMA_333G00060 [Zostera marina]|uniref:Uncharacterized protein n=1 Tax=Zostera marina TaxID=29655 RepID=A0A0K9P880_ZOSMR|nr:hypothetical protein ZOSMA_333G00060 [Zostera marina]
MMEKYPHFVSKDALGHKSYITKVKYNLVKPISELDLSNSEQCTPSYRRLPRKHHIPCTIAL